MADLRTSDGDTVAEDLTRTEIERLEQAGVPVDTADDGDGDGGDEPADGDPSDDADTSDGSGGGGSDDADTADDADPDPDTDPDGDGGGGSDAPDDTDPADDPTSAGSDGSAEGDGEPDDGGDADAGGGGDPADDSRADDEPTDAPDDQTHGPDDGPDLDPDALDDLDDPDEWDDDAGSGADPAGGDGDPDDGDPVDDPDDTPTGGNAGGAGPDDLDDAVDDMLDRSDARDVSERAGDDGIDGNDDRWQDRLDRIRSSSDIPEATRARNERLADNRQPHVHTDEYRPWAEGSGFIDDIVEQFKKIKEAPKPTNANRGSDLDRKRLTRFRSGDKGARDFYLRSNGDRTKARRAVGVAVDLSGSMGDPADPSIDPYDPDVDMDEVPTRLHVAKTAVGGLAHAVETIGDTFTASGFTENHWGEGGEADAPLITAPGEQFEWQHLDAVGGARSTPMGYGIRKGAQRLLQTDQPEKTLFVIADGDPSDPGMFDNTEPESRHATENVSAMVSRARSAGVDVVGVGIGDVNERAMYQMFRESGSQDPDAAPYIMADAENLPEKLAGAYEDTLK